MERVAVGIISQKNSRGEDAYLLVRSTLDFGKFTGCWYPPGGHCEKGASEETALIQKVHEELGLVVQPLKKITETPSDIENQRTSWWQCQIVGTADFCVDNEKIADAGFFAKRQMQHLRLWPATGKFFEEFIWKPKR